MQLVKGPDFPTGGIIVGSEGIKQAYGTGHGRIIVRGRAVFEESKAGYEQIVIEEIPYQANKSSLVAKIAELVSERKIEGIRDLSDESDRNGMRIVIELKKDAPPSPCSTTCTSTRPCSRPSARSCWRWSTAAR